MPLGAGPNASALARRVANWDGLVCLHGDWAGGAALLTSHPVVVSAGAAEMLDRQPSVPAADGLVGGGWFGWLGFDGTSRLAFHDHVVRLVDGQWQFESLWTPGRAAALAARLAAWRAALRGPELRPAWSVGPVDVPPADVHLAAVERGIELIRAGELYQVNVCTRLSAPFAGSPAALFADAVAELEPRYAAYVGAPGCAVVSLSPELFLRRQGRQVTTAPIKGTLPRTAPGNDVALRKSTKDAAENVMIVDLMRNDLNRVCEPGSVRVPELLAVEAHPGVWHLVSTVTGRLRPGVGDAALLLATFPPGSVTGAPKLRAVAAIGELEAAPRGTYTGAVGFASPIWGAEFNVAIRTFEIAAGRLELGVGGGVTADSVPVLEWRECVHKAAPLLAAARTDPLAVAELGPTPDQLAGGLLETVLAIDGAPVRLADHLARLDRSSREVYGTGLPADVARRVIDGAAGRTGRTALRVVLGPDRAVEVSAAPIGPAPEASAAAVSRRPPAIWRHKWADRAALAALERRAAPAVPLFVAADGAVLETSRGNVFLITADGSLVTPPLRDDLLPGVTRRALLDLARDSGRPTVLRTFDLDELLRCPAFWTSSLSGAVPIHRVDGVDLPRADDEIAELAGRLQARRPGIGLAVRPFVR